MGSSNSNPERTNQNVIAGHPLNEANRYENKISRSICQLTINITENTYICGTGFLIKLNTDNENEVKYFLMTNEHVIERKYIEEEEKNLVVDVKYDSEFKDVKIKLDKSERFINAYENIIDLTIVEILKKDNINEEFFLEPDYDGKIKDQIIYIPQYPADRKYSGKLWSSDGPIEAKDNYEIAYKASTDGGSSGSPIFLKESIKVIGIHKQGGEQENYGDLLLPILNIFKNNGEKIYFKSGDYYQGEWRNGLKHGKGTLYYDDGQILYEGDFVDDKFDGFGKYYYQESEFYVEKWRDKKEHDKILYYSGKLFDGDFIEHQAKGNKLEFYEYGNYYEGEWSNGKKHGRGRTYSKNGNIKSLFDGGKENEKYKYENGEYYNLKYDGEFRNDKLNGNGKYYYKNGDCYSGEFEDNLKNGFGQVNDKDGNLKFKGEYRNDYEYNGYIGERDKDGLRHGKGKLYRKGRLVYDGNFINDKYEGNGKYIYEGGEYYEGEFKNGKFHGEGKIYYNNGEIKYDGKFNNNSIVLGKHIYPNGNYYYGEYKNWLRDGKGEIHYKNGNIRKGTFKKGDLVKNENEICYDIIKDNDEIKFEEGLYYKGQTKNGLMHGKGKLYYNNGKIMYDGNFVDGNYEGEGVLYYTNEKIKYIGDFVDGKYEGKGKYHSGNGILEYEGEFRNDEKNGKGKEYYENGKIKYDGYFIDDIYEGKGIFYYKNGNYYECEFINGNRFGNGIMYYKKYDIIYKGNFNDESKYIQLNYENGNIYYEGEFNFKNGEKNGKGKEYYENGNIKYEGEFINDKKNGKGIEYYGDRKIKHKGYFKNDFYNFFGNLSYFKKIYSSKK